MIIKEYDRGSAIVEESEFEIYEAFVGYAPFDPTIFLVTVTDPNGIDKVDAENLVKKELGKYSYKIQTDVDWIIGTYQVKIVCSNDVNNDVTVEERAFSLK